MSTSTDRTPSPLTDMPSDATEHTHFGFESVNKANKAQRVADVFHSVAPNYDLMNDVMSFGIHRLWKKIAIHLAGIQMGHHILDLAGGTGDLSIKMSSLVGETGSVILSDINTSMLAEGKKRVYDAGIAHNVQFECIDAEHIPYPDQHFHLVTIGFGLRNVTDKMAALKEIKRVLKPGGRLLVLEFSQPQHPLLAKAYDFYSFNLLPLMGKWIAKDEKSYRYLAESIRMHPDQETLKQLMQTAGFDEVDYHNLTGGIVAIHRGFIF